MVSKKRGAVQKLPASWPLPAAPRSAFGEDRLVASLPVHLCTDPAERCFCVASMASEVVTYPGLSRRGAEDGSERRLSACTLLRKRLFWPVPADDGPLRRFSPRAFRMRRLPGHSFSSRVERIAVPAQRGGPRRSRCEFGPVPAAVRDSGCDPEGDGPRSEGRIGWRMNKM